jgi:hypothetical protein
VPKRSCRSLERARHPGPFPVAALKQIPSPLLRRGESLAVLHWFTGPATLVERGCSTGLSFPIYASMIPHVRTSDHRRNAPRTSAHR